MSPTTAARSTASGQLPASRPSCSEWETPIAAGTTLPRQVSSRRESPAGAEASPVVSVTSRLYPAPCGSTTSGASSCRIELLTVHATARSKGCRVASSQLSSRSPTPSEVK